MFAPTHYVSRCRRSRQERANGAKLIVTTFKDLDVAERAARDFRNFEKGNEGFKIESRVKVQKDAAGKLTILENTPSRSGVR